MFPNRIQVDFHCFWAASFWDHFFLAFSTGGGDLDGPGPGGAGVGVRERACGGKGRVGAERRRRRPGGGGRGEGEHNSPVPVRAYGLENRSHARLAPKKGIGHETGHVCSFFAESLQIEQAGANFGLPAVRTVQPL